jgi:hypothetical protein
MSLIDALLNAQAIIHVTMKSTFEAAEMALNTVIFDVVILSGDLY